MQLEFIKNTKDQTILRKKGEKINYNPWPYEWRGMNESERRERGLFVFCYGMGDFQIFKEGIDVKIV